MYTDHLVIPQSSAMVSISRMYWDVEESQVIEVGTGMNEDSSWNSLSWKHLNGTNQNSKYSYSRMCSFSTNQTYLVE